MRWSGGAALSGEVSGRNFEGSEESAVLGGAKRVSQYLASNPGAVNTAQRVAAENNQRVGPSEKHVDDRQILTDTAGAADVSPEDTAEYHASARARLLAVRRLKARDPDDQPELGSPPVCRREVGPRRLTAASSRWCTLLTTTRSSSTTWSRKGPVPRVKLVPGP